MVYRRGAGGHERLRRTRWRARRRTACASCSTRQPVAFVRDAAGAVVGAPRRGHAGRRPGRRRRARRCRATSWPSPSASRSSASVAAQFPGVALDRRGCVVADAATGATGNPKVFSGGDCVNGGKEVVNAVADGRNAAACTCIDAK